jgi:choline dehydrogenase
MAYVRRNAADYNEWASEGNSGWSYDEVLPYCKRSECHETFGEPRHSKNGLLNVSFARYPSALSKVFVEACMECGIPFNEDYDGAQQLGAGMLQFTIKNNKRYSTATAFLQPIHRKNLTYPHRYRGKGDHY